MNRLVTFLLVLLALNIIGCGVKKVDMQPVQIKYVDTNHVVDKNFVIDAKQKANVGESVIWVKDYYVLMREAKTLTAIKDSRIIHDTLSGEDLLSKYEKGQAVDIESQVTVEGQDYYIIPTNSHNKGAYLYDFKIAIQKDGTVVNDAFDNGDNSNSNNVISRPKGPIFQRTTEPEIDTTAGYINYEIIYLGTDKGTLRLMYREYTPENMARVAFFQELTYSLDSNIIRFRDIKIQVHEVNNESIAYTVLSF